MIDPPHALANLRALEAMGALGEYGFCDALDYTRPAPGERVALVRAYMAHHIGMTLVALTNVLRDDVWQDRFHADALVKSVELLLHERVPRRLVAAASAARATRRRAARSGHRAAGRSRRERRTARAAPRVALLGSAPYTVMLNHNGSGYSRYESTRGDALARRQHPRRHRAVLLSQGPDVGPRLVRVPPARLRAGRLDPRACWPPTGHACTAIDGDIETRTEITVVPGDAAEVRRVTLTNTGRRAHDIELTSYGEVVLAPPAADQAHPAFSNLFVRDGVARLVHGDHRHAATAHTRRSPSLVRPRGRYGARSARRGVLRDRSRALHRTRPFGARSGRAWNPMAPSRGRRARCSIPIFALRTRVRVMPGQSVSVAFTTLVAETRAERVRAGRPVSRRARRAAGARLRVDRDPDRAAGTGHHAGQRRGLSGHRDAVALPRRLAGAAGG